AWPPWGFSLPLFTWIAYLGVGWWAHKYADGGGYIVQRICAARNDRDSGRTMLMFVFLHYIVRPWPWIFVALASLVAYPALTDHQSAYPLMMLRHMPPGLLGLMVTAFLAAFMSTIDTHIHWGSSYWVHDLYARFLVKNAPDRHYVTVGRLSGVLVLALAVVIAGNLRSITSAWKILYLLGAGLGPVVLARWLWWKVSAASELFAFGASLALATTLVILDWPADYGLRLLIVSAGSALVWIPVTFWRPSRPTEALEAFFHQVRPPAVGWRVFTPRDPAGHLRLRDVAAQWALGVAACVLFLYGIAMLLFGPRLPGAAACTLAAGFTVAFFRTGQKM
ncbi:MAG: sodium:proline symporter, partial [Deltaproteobacteria bacterium HGW-Deltaproteobacteria-17]